MRSFKVTGVRFEYGWEGKAAEELRTLHRQGWVLLCDPVIATAGGGTRILYHHYKDEPDEDY